jgi:uncharacterized protein YkwD
VTGAVASLGLGAVLTACAPPFSASPGVTASGPAASASAVASPGAAPVSAAPSAAPSAATAPSSPSASVSAAPTTVPATPMTPPTSAPPKPPATTAPPAVPPAGTLKTDQIVVLTNAERAKAGCGPLVVDARLTSAAQAHSTDMAQHSYFDHTSLDGRTFDVRIRATGFPLSAVAENIAAGSAAAADTMTQWMNSPGHRANILNCAYNRIGVGYAEGGSYRYYWTQDFGKV